ncbi:LysE/ArgO family amino acid transporter [Vibrio profundum]|uniref:LysE/ArgO family amino acid transporter n=1 Tax=Vibrio profundum TaxID=2910247 RepID=UPI003D0E9DEA
MNVWVVLQGLSVGLSMIVPIGAQNAYVLRQGSTRSHHLLVASLCSVLDMLFIFLGVFWGGSALSTNETLLTVVSIAGIVFLLVYGTQSAYSVWTHQIDSVSDVAPAKRRKRAVIAGTLAVSLLNPHVYLDTIVVLGSIGSHFDKANRVSFAIGAMLASLVWFYGLAVFSAKFSPILSRPPVQRAINFVVAVVMFSVAAMLIKGLYIRII